MLVAESNPCYSLPNAQTVQGAFDRIPFVVSFSSFMDETAMNADLILPNHHNLERLEDVPVAAGMTRPVVGLCRPVVAPLYNTQHLGDTILQIAKALKGTIATAFPWQDYQSCLRTTLGDRWQALNAEGVWVGSEGQGSNYETPSGKFVLLDNVTGGIFMADDVSMEGQSADFPLVLIPYDSIRLASRFVGDPPFMIKTVSDTVLKGQDGIVEINPDTAKKLGLTDGQTAQLSTPVGSAKVRVHYSEGIRPELVAMPRGLGHTAYDGYLAGKGVNINRLIGPVEDPVSGLDAAWGIGAKLV